MLFAVVNPRGGRVVNVVVGEAEEVVVSVVGPCVEVTQQTGPAGIGWEWNGSRFVEPAIEPES